MYIPHEYVRLFSTKALKQAIKAFNKDGEAILTYSADKYIKFDHQVAFTVPPEKVSRIKGFFGFFPRAWQMMQYRALRVFNWVKTRFMGQKRYTEYLQTALSKLNGQGVAGLKDVQAFMNHEETLAAAVKLDAKLKEIMPKLKPQLDALKATQVALEEKERANTLSQNDLAVIRKQSEQFFEALSQHLTEDDLKLSQRLGKTLLQDLDELPNKIIKKMQTISASTDDPLTQQVNLIKKLKDAAS